MAEQQLITPAEPKPVCPPGAHNPVRRAGPDSWLKNRCGKCGRFIVFIKRVWIVDVSVEGEEFRQ